MKHKLNCSTSYRAACGVEMTCWNESDFHICYGKDFRSGWVFKECGSVSFLQCIGQQKDLYVIPYQYLLSKAVVFRCVLIHFVIKQ